MTDLSESGLHRALKEFVEGDPVVSDHRISMLEQRFAAIEDAMVNIDNKLDKIADALHILARVEERQAASNERLRTAELALADQSQRLRTIEVSLPGLVETRRWVVTGVLAGLGMICIAVVNLVLK
jgi:hypothetical protein